MARQYKPPTVDLTSRIEADQEAGPGSTSLGQDREWQVPNAFDQFDTGPCAFFSWRKFRGDCHSGRAGTTTEERDTGDDAGASFADHYRGDDRSAIGGLPRAVRGLGRIEPSEIPVNAVRWWGHRRPEGPKYRGLRIFRRISSNSGTGR